MSWRPDLGAWKPNAFHLPWKKLKGYAFPPFVRIGRVLAKLRGERATLVMITSLSQAQPWILMPLQFPIAIPILLSQTSDLLSDSKGHPHPLIKRDRLPSEGFRQKLANKGISVQAAFLIEMMYGSSGLEKSLLSYSA